MTDKLSKL